MKITGRDNAVRVSVHVQPRAARSEIVGEHGDAVKVRLAAPPVEGAANDELCRFIAKTVGVPASRVAVVSGAGSRQKVIEIAGVDVEHVQAAVLRAMKSK